MRVSISTTPAVAGQITVTVDGEDITNRCCAADTWLGIAEVYVLDDKGNPQKHPFRNTLPWTEIVKGHVRVCAWHPGPSC